MKKYFVIGKPIEHSLSPKLHNYWIKKNNIHAVYDKKLVNEDELGSIISKIKNKDIEGINVTVPFKKVVIPFLDDLSPEAKQSQSVNTVYRQDGKIFGHNTDISGFELGIKYSKFSVRNKKVFILGAGGVVPSIIVALKKMGADKIIISNRTMENAEKLKKFLDYIEISEWGKLTNANMIINATSIGLNENDKMEISFDNISPNTFFYDVIYSSKETDFIKKAKATGNKTENGKMMFIYQAHQAFTIWHKVMPNIDQESISLLEND